MLTTGSCNDLTKVFDTTGEFILETIAIRNGVRNSPFLLTMLKQKRIERVVDSKVLLEYDFTSAEEDLFQNLFGLFSCGRCYITETGAAVLIKT